MWLNLTLFNQSALFTVIRELEYALLQLTHLVDELLMAVQYTLRKITHNHKSKRFIQHIAEYFFVFA